MALAPHRRLAAFRREAGTLSLHLAAPGLPDAEGMTPAVVLVERGSRGLHEVTIHAHELPRVARLLADAQRLLAAADPAPDPAAVISRRTHRAYLERKAATGDAIACEALADLNEAERE